MRDTERINSLLRRLSFVWRCSPDLRLGQLLINACEMYGTDLYDVDDYDLLIFIERMVYDKEENNA
jgi:uncharacterized protein YihD (DUF1040 family)